MGEHGWLSYVRTGAVVDFALSNSNAASATAGLQLPSNILAPFTLRADLGATFDLSQLTISIATNSDLPTVIYGVIFEHARNASLLIQSSNVVLDNCTIVNGRGLTGAAVSVTLSTLTIYNSRLLNNTAACGAALFLSQSTVTLSNVDLVGNSAVGGLSTFNTIYDPEARFSLPFLRW